MNTKQQFVRPANGGQAVPLRRADDARSHPAYHAGRGYTTVPLASGGRKRQIEPAP